MFHRFQRVTVAIAGALLIGLLAACGQSGASGDYVSVSPHDVELLHIDQIDAHTWKGSLTGSSYYNGKVTQGGNTLGGAISAGRFIDTRGPIIVIKDGVATMTVHDIFQSRTQTFKRGSEAEYQRAVAKLGK